MILYLMLAVSLSLLIVLVPAAGWSGARIANARVAAERRRHGEEIEELTAAHLDEIETCEIQRNRDAHTFKAAIASLQAENDRIKAANAALFERVNDFERQALRGGGQ